MQRHSSKNTSINSKTIPSAFAQIAKRGLFHAGDCVLDYGCGKYPEVAANFLRNKVGCYIPYDPMQNIGSLRCFDIAGKIADIGVMSNVINVIDDMDAVLSAIKTAKQYCHTLYITVYEGDKSGVGKESKDDCWQANMKIADWYRLLSKYFQIVRKGSLLIIGEE